MDAGGEPPYELSGRPHHEAAGARSPLAASCSPARSLRPRRRRRSRPKYRYGPVEIGRAGTRSSSSPTTQAAGRRLHPQLHAEPDALDGSVPPVDVAPPAPRRLAVNGAPLFAAGEEKTERHLPPGYGWLYRTSDSG